MNADTGEMYFTRDAVLAAQERGERLVELTRQNIDNLIDPETGMKKSVVPMSAGKLRRLMREQGK